jgi:microcin C transport system substrate-binding protein
VAFGKIATHNFLGRDVEKDMEYHDKNFPVNKAWVPASAGMTPWEEISSHSQAFSNARLGLIYKILFFIILMLGCNASLQASYYIAQKECIKPKYDGSFSHLDYVNPEAPKGGTIRLKAPNRTFRTFYPYAFKLKGAEATQLLYASLCKAPEDDLTVAYAYGAKDVQIDAEKGLVTFTLRPNITFENGQPITSKDVIYSLEFAGQYGIPTIQEALKGLTFKALDSHRVQVHMGSFSQEIAFLISKIPIIPHGTKKGETPLSSGPYRVQSYKIGYRIVYKRVPNWWGTQLPVNKGLYNFDQVEYLYFANSNSGFEGFKKHLYDVRLELKIGVWNRQYNFSSIREGKVLRKDFKKPVINSLTMWVFNTQRTPLDDWRVRKALSLFFNFERINKTFFSNYYRRDASIFSNTGFAASAQITPAIEKVLAPYKDKLPNTIWSEALVPIAHDTPQKTRALWKQAYTLLQEAGWTLEDGVLKHTDTGKPFHLEIVLTVPEYAKYLQDYVHTLRTFGITVQVSVLDPTQYTYRVRQGEYDMMMEQNLIPPIPGQEQKSVWGQFKDPVVNALADRLTQAQTMEDLKVYAAALDYVVQKQYYAILGWYADNTQIAFYNDFGYVNNAFSLFHPLTWWPKVPEKKA